MTSNDELAAQIVGIREERLPLDAPGELGFHCPVCQYPLFHDDEYDDRLTWSQYNGFLRCSTCDKNYPSSLCMPNVDRAIKIYLLCVKEAIERVRKQSAPRQSGLKAEKGIRVAGLVPAAHVVSPLILDHSCYRCCK